MSVQLSGTGALVRCSVGTAQYVLGNQLRDPRMDRLTRAVTCAGDAHPHHRQRPHPLKERMVSRKYDPR